METMIRDRFVQQVLEHQGQRLLRNQGGILYKKLKFRTGRLESGRSIAIAAGSGSMDGKLSFRHMDYERFQDMRRSVTRKKGDGRRTRPGFRLHNRFVYVTYFSIARQLGTGLTEDIRGHLTTELKKEING